MFFVFIIVFSLSGGAFIDFLKPTPFGKDVNPSWLICFERFYTNHLAKGIVVILFSWVFVDVFRVVFF